MSKDEANTMSDKPAAFEQGGEGDAGRETMQALDRLESEIAPPADRGLWGARLDAHAVVRIGRGAHLDRRQDGRHIGQPQRADGRRFAPPSRPVPVRNAVLVP
jgi:hypothetical protein